MVILLQRKGKKNMEEIRLLEQNQEKILDMIRTKTPIARKSGKTGTLVYLMEKWLEIEFMKNDILEQMEEKRKKEESKKHLRYATRQELERVVRKKSGTTIVPFLVLLSILFDFAIILLYIKIINYFNNFLFITIPPYFYKF